MSHADKRWQAHYGGPGQGQQYRCVLCGVGGASGRESKPLTYHCMACREEGHHDTMWPTPQYQKYREVVLEVERLRAALKSIADGMENEPAAYAGLVLDGTL